MPILKQQDGFLKKVAWVLFICCMLILTRYILFKGAIEDTKVSFSKVTGKKVTTKGFKRANLVPFATLKLFYSVRKKYTYVAKNVLGNIIGFIPLGVLLPVLFLRLQRWYKTILIVALISLLYEFIQLLTRRGVFDVDDILLNTIGGAIGYLLYFMTTRLMLLNTKDAA